MLVRSLKRSLPEILGRAAAAPCVLALFDFDGTLAPDHPDPDKAHLPEPAREWLAEMAGSPRAAVGIISGRRLCDLTRRCGLEGIVYGGNHGIEIRGRGLHYLEPFSFLLEPAMKEALADLGEHLGHLPQVRIENKGLTGTVHLAGGNYAETTEVILSHLRRAPNLRCLCSRRSVEILPQSGWTKGSAIQWIQGRLEMEQALVIYAGDDASDEEAFHALPGALTIKIGSEPTAAAYAADSPAELWALLAQLPGALSAHRSFPPRPSQAIQASAKPASLGVPRNLSFRR